MANLKDTSINGNLSINGTQKTVDIVQGDAVFNTIETENIETGYLRTYAKAIPVIIARGTQTVGSVSVGANIITPYSFTLARPMRILANATVTNRPGGDNTGDNSYIYLDMRMNGTIFSMISMNSNSSSTHIRSNQFFGLVDLPAGTHEFRMVLNNIPSGTRNFGGADSAPAVSWELTAFENI